MPLDVLCASGTSYFGRPATPYVPGVQGVGVVEGPASARVFFPTGAGMAPGVDGGLAELVAVRDADLVPVPDAAADVPDAALAALGLSAVAAWAALAWRAGVRPGDRVVVLGCGGAVGQVGLAAARALGAARVVGVCRSDAAAERATGADEVLVSTDASTLTERVLEAAGGPVDVVLDPVFGATAEAVVRAAADGARVVNLGGAGSDTATFSSALLRSRSISLLGHTNNSLSPARKAEAFTAVVELAARGDVEVAHRVASLDDVADAWADTAAGRAAPRWVLAP